MVAAAAINQAGLDDQVTHVGRDQDALRAERAVAGPALGRGDHQRGRVGAPPAVAKQAAKMADQALKGETVEINDTTTYDNLVKVVPSYLLTPISIDINNYQKELVDSGYIKAEDLQ